MRTRLSLTNSLSFFFFSFSHLSQNSYFSVVTLNAMNPTGPVHWPNRRTTPVRASKHDRQPLNIRARIRDRIPKPLYPLIRSFSCSCPSGARRPAPGGGAFLAPATAAGLALPLGRAGCWGARRGATRKRVSTAIEMGLQTEIGLQKIVSRFLGRPGYIVY